MDKQQLILAIANDLADRVKDSKRPYYQLKWIAENCDWQYKANNSEMTEAYFAAINILKARSVENAKRKPLTALSKQERTTMRKQAKEFVGMVKRFMGNPIQVERDPIKGSGDSAFITIAVKSGTNNSCTGFYHPTLEELSKWALMEESSKVGAAYKFAQRYKPADDRIAENLEVIKANLESSLDSLGKA